jgi:hypothetical protein
MPSNDIVCIVNGNTFVLNPNNPSSLQQIPEMEKTQLIRLLEALKQQASSVAQPEYPYSVATGAPETPIPETTQAAFSPATNPGMKGRKLSEAEIGHLMAQLAMEERGRDRQPVTRRGLYIFLAIMTVAIMMLFLIP